MPALKKMLLSYDIDLIGRISPFWGVDSTNADFSAAVNALLVAMGDSDLVTEILDSLPAPALDAWNYLCVNNCKITWANFSRKFGEIREFGPAKREREMPESHPISAAELLWYRGLIGRAFLNISPEPREFAYIPDELLKLANQTRPTAPLTMIRPATKSELKKEFLANGRILDHVTDWLSASRMKRALPPETCENLGIPEVFISALAGETGLIDKSGIPETDSLKQFFQADRQAVLHEWFTKWSQSTRINDLRMLPELSCEGAWQNDPLRPRQVICETLQTLHSAQWYSLSSFINSIKINQPDFQRPSGDYDSWFIRKSGTNTYLRGFDHWDEVDGALIKYILTGPLHWFGLVDLSTNTDQSEFVAFRLTKQFTNSISNSTIVNKPFNESNIRISNDLQFVVPIGSSLTLRYQIGRFCDLLSATKDETFYQITPASLIGAQEQGLKPAQLVQLLEKMIKMPLPKPLTLMAGQWENHGLESRIEKQVLLRTARPEVLESLRQNDRVSKFILEVLTPTTAVVNKNGIELIKKTLIEQGILTQVELEV